MMKIYLVRILVFLFVLTNLAYGQGKVRLANKFGNDSTVFTLSVDSKQKIEQGKTFEARIKVKQNGWHLYSSKMSPDVGPTPLTITLPPELSKTYKLVSIKEKGKVEEKFDENFGGVLPSPKRLQKKRLSLSKIRSKHLRMLLIEL